MARAGVYGRYPRKTGGAPAREDIPTCRLCGQPVLPGTGRRRRSREHAPCLRLYERARSWESARERAEKLAKLHARRPDLAIWLSELLDAQPGILATGVCTLEQILDLWRSGWGAHWLTGPVRKGDVQRMLRGAGIRRRRGLLVLDGKRKGPRRGR